MALLGVAAALTLTVALRPLVHRNLLVPFIGAIAAAAWVGGLRGGLLATALSVAGAGYLLLSVRYSPLESLQGDLAALAVTAAIGVFISWLVHRLGQAQSAGRSRAAELAMSDGRFRRLVEDVTDYAIFGLDPEGRIVTWNAGAERLTGYRTEEALGRHFSLFYPDEERARGHPDDELRWAAEHGRYAEEGWRIRQDGTRFCASVVITASRDEQGRLLGFSKVTRDLTERRRAEEALAASEARLAAILGSTMDAIVTTDSERRIVFFNAAAEEIFRIPAAEALGTSVDRFIPPPLRERHAEHMRQFGSTGLTMRSMHSTPGALPALRGDGTEFRIDATISQVEVGGERYLTVVLRDATERLRGEAERDALIAELRMANRAKSEFLATMSHELRTPLNAIMGYSDLLEVGIAGEVTQRQRDYLGRVRASGEHLLGLINDVLDMARLDANRLEVRSETEPLRGVVQGALDLVLPQATAKSIRLSDGSDCYPVKYRGDPDRVRQVLLNLLSNAVKFTPPGGSITVLSHISAQPPAGTRLAGRGPWVGVSVTDTGIGIPGAEIERVFEPFVQVASTHTREHGGTGLGLAISRRLARLMEADLVGESEVGNGSTFTLWLPVVAAAEPAAVTEEPIAWPSRPREVPGLTELGRLLRERAEEISRSLGDRLATDPAVPTARGLDRAQLEDHFASILQALGKELITLDEGGGEPALMRDGTDVQRLIAERHGEQRARLRWSPAEVRHEYALLRDAVRRLIVAGPVSNGDTDPGAALHVLHHLLDRAERVSLAAFTRSL